MHMPFSFINRGAYDSYMDDYMLLFIIISLLIIIYVNDVNCINVREYYRYSLIINKSLSWMLLLVHITYIHSHQPLTYLLFDRHFQLELLLIYVTMIHWIITHMTPQAYILLVVCLLYKELHNTALGVSLG